MIVTRRIGIRIALIVLVMTAGTAMIMWMGELITQRGIGNGMSILIFSSVISRLPQEGRAILLGSSGALVGRSRECDVVIDDENVSRRHAEVRPSGGAWIVRDLGSTNGVKVNGQRITGAQSLRPGDRIEIGLSTLTYEEG